MYRTSLKFSEALMLNSDPCSYSWHIITWPLPVEDRPPYTLVIYSYQVSRNNDTLEPPTLHKPSKLQCYLWGYLEGPAVGDSVVHDQQQQVVLRRQSDQERAHKRPGRQIKRHSRLALHPRQNRLLQAFRHLLRAAHMHTATSAQVTPLILFFIPFRSGVSF